jgi:hypothetical protein
MANDYLNMLDIAKTNGSDQIVGLIEENLNIAPEVNLFPARTVSGTSFKTLLRTALPTPGFRAANEGVNTTRSSYQNKLVECFYFDAKMEMDVAVAGADDQGEAHALALEADGQMQGTLLKMGSQIWYGSGTGGDAKGFPGAVQIVDSNLVVDATGTTASTGSSVYGVKLGEKYASLVFGNGSIFNMGEWIKQRITRSSKELTAWINSMEGWVGVQWVNKYSVCRIKKLTADSGKGLTDALGAQLISQLPANFVPDYWFMSRRSRLQLQQSRATVTNNASNAVQFPPTPTEMNGIPIQVTDSILNTEALTL